MQKMCCNVANLFRENWEMTFWTQNMLFMVFLCRWHLILDIQLQYQMLTMMGKFKNFLTHWILYSSLKMLYFFLHDIHPSIFPQQDRGSLGFFFVFFFSSRQEDITTEELSIIRFNVFTTSALLRKLF